MYQGAGMSLVQWCKSGVVQVIIWDWSYDWLSPDLIRLRYLKVWWSWGAGLALNLLQLYTFYGRVGCVIGRQFGQLPLLSTPGWENIWSICLHMLKDVQRLRCLIHDLCVWEPDQPVANTYAPIITPVVLDNFFCWLLCMGGVPPNKEVLICYNLICLKRPVDSSLTFFPHYKHKFIQRSSQEALQWSTGQRRGRNLHVHSTNLPFLEEEICCGTEAKRGPGRSWPHVGATAGMDEGADFRLCINRSVKVYQRAWTHSWAPEAWTGSGCILVLTRTC